MALDIYTPHDLYAVMYDDRQTVSTSQWLDMFFPNSFFSTQEEILFDKIASTRKIAPFMLPNESGRPIYKREGERIQSFKPAYTKPKDAVRPAEMLALQPGELAGRMGLMTPQGRYDAEVVRITQYQRNAINRLWDYMAAKAVIDGAITVNYATDSGAPGQSVVIDFGRDAGHTISLSGTAEWGDAGVSIMGGIQTWVDLIANAEFGGSARDVILAPGAAALFMADAEIKELLNTDYRGSEDVHINRSIIRTDPMNPFTYLGTLGSGIRVWRYVGSFMNDDGTTTNVMGNHDCVVAAPNVDGVKAFGAILDVAAGIQAADIFVKMWDQEDPSARFIMSQSAPLMIPVNPNCTLKATVKQ